jgi:hypothetical protein
VREQAQPARNRPHDGREALEAPAAPQRQVTGQRREAHDDGPGERGGDHRWWISDLTGFRRDYPEWELRYDLETTLREIHDANVERWAVA